VLVTKPEKTARKSHENNIGKDVREMEWKCVNWIHLTYDTDHWQVPVNHGNEAFGSIIGREFVDKANDY
jgi:hypothetical protein